MISPGRFSPNVILRPLYQEMILPNLAYVGGPSEISYWLQLKSVFDHLNIAFPILIPRNFATVVPNKTAAKWNKTGLAYRDLFLEPNSIFLKWIDRHSKHDLSFKEELEKLTSVYKVLGKKAALIDPTLMQHLEGLMAIAKKKVANAEKKLIRAEKRKHSNKKRQILDVRNVVFPKGTLQERRVNFLDFYLEDPQFIQKLLNTFDAFDHQMYLIFA